MGFSEEIDGIFSNWGREIDDHFNGNKKAPNEKDPFFFLKIILFFIVLIILSNLPILIFSIIFFFLWKWVDKKSIAYFAGGISTLILCITLYVNDFRNFFQFLSIYRKLLPSFVRVLEEIIQGGKQFEITWVTWEMTLLASLTVSTILFSFYKRLNKNWITREKEEEKQSYLESEKYKSILRKKDKILQNTQNAYRDKELGAEKKVLLGNDIKGLPVTFPSKNLFTHTFIQGTTGTGKTYMMYNIMEEAIREDFGVLFVDGKGDPKTVKEIRTIAENYGKKVYVFSDKASDSPDGQLWHYNPVAHGKPTAVTERLMAVMDWSESFYENESKNLLQQITMFLQDYIKIEKKRKTPRAIQGEPLKMNLETIHRFLDLSELANYLFIEQSEEIIEGIQTDMNDVKEVDSTGASHVIENIYNPEAIFKKYMKMFFRKDSLDIGDLDNIKEDYKEQNKLIRGLKTQIEQLIYSDLGERFTEKENCTIDLEQVLKNGDVAIFSLDSNNYNAFIPTIGRFIVADSAYITTTLYGNTENFNGVLGIFDEFGSYGSDNILDILSKARSAKFGAILGVQSITDLANKRRNIDIKQQTIDNCNLFIMGRTNSTENAEEIAGLFGTYRDIDRTVMTENQLGSLARFETKGERGSVRKVNKYEVNPDDLKDLPNHQFFYLNKNLTSDNKKKVFARNVFTNL